MELQTVTLVCDGTTQTLANFQGIVTYCLVKNGRFSSTIAVSVRGIKKALLAPGYAIACRTSLVKVKGAPGAVVALEFVGLPDLAMGI